MVRPNIAVEKDSCFLWSSQQHLLVVEAIGKDIMKLWRWKRNARGLVGRRKSLFRIEKRDSELDDVFYIYWCIFFLAQVWREEIIESIEVIEVLWARRIDKTRRIAREVSDGKATIDTSWAIPLKNRMQLKNDDHDRNGALGLILIFSTRSFVLRRATRGISFRVVVSAMDAVVANRRWIMGCISAGTKRMHRIAFTATHYDPG